MHFDRIGPRLGSLGSGFGGVGDGLFGAWRWTRGVVTGWIPGASEERAADSLRVSQLGH